jgi:hypothetical protein
LDLLGTSFCKNSEQTKVELDDKRRHPAPVRTT